MSKVIDNRIVKMGIDNADLVRKAAQSITALSGIDKAVAKLKGVNLGNGLKGLSNVSKDGDAAKGALERIATASEGLRSRFSVLGGVAANVLTGMIMKAGQTAKEWIGISQGFEEYGTKMKAIQVIMSNTQGKSSLTDINNTLNDLNHYADKTIYSFTDMTSAIGKFTAAGVSLDDSADAIQGLSNWAAESGTNTTDLSRAQDQLSQALASGVVKLQDWNSVQNAGGLGGKKFQTALEDTAKSMGKGRDMTKSFRDSLQDGWLTSEVMLKTLRKFKDDKSMEAAATQAHTFADAMDATKEAIGSGWTDMFEAIFGNAQESTKIWTALQNALSGVIQKSFQGRISMLKDWAALGGRAKAVDAISNIWKSLTEVLGAVSKAFAQVFPPTTGKQLYSMTAAFDAFTKKLIPSQHTLELLGDVFKGLFSIIHIGVEIVTLFGKVLWSLIPTSVTGGKGFLEFAAMIGRVIYAFDQATNFANLLNPVLWLIKGTVNLVAAAFGLLAIGVVRSIDLIIKGVRPVEQFVVKAFTAMAGQLDKLRQKFISNGGGAGDWSTKMAAAYKTAADASKKAYAVMYDHADDWSVYLGKAYDKAKSATITFAEKASNAYDSARVSMQNFGKVAQGWGDNMVKMYDKVKESIQAFKTWVGTSSSTVAKVLKAIGRGIQNVYEAVKPLIKSLSAKDLVSMLGIVKAASSIKSLNKLSDGLTSFFSNLKKGTSTVSAATIFAMGTALLEMAVAIKMMADLDIVDVSKGLEMLVVNLTAMVLATKALSKIGDFKGSQTKMVITLLGMAEAMKIMAEAFAKAGQVDTDKIGLVTIAMLTALTGEVALMTYVSGNVDIMKSGAKDALVYSASLYIISKALVELGSLDTNQMLTALGGLTVVFVELGVLIKLINGKGGKGGAGGGLQIDAGVAVGVSALGFALLEMAGSIAIIASIPFKKLKQGLIGVGLALSGLAAFAIGMKYAKVDGVAPGILALSLAVAALVVPITALGALPWPVLLQGLVAMGVALAEIALASKAMEGSSGGSLTTLAMAAALNAIVIPIAALGALPMSVVAQGLIAVGAAFGIIVLAAMGMQASSVGLLAFAAAMGAIGLAALGIGTVLTAFTASLTVLAGLTTVAINKIIGALSALLQGALTLIPQFVKVGVSLITNLASGLAQSAVQLGTSALNIILGLLTVLSNNAYRIASVAVQLITNLINGLADNTHRFVEAAVNFVTTFVQSMADAIREHSEEIVTAILDTIEAILELVIQALTKVIGILFGWIHGVKDKMKEAGAGATDALRGAFDIDKVAKDKTAGYNKEIENGQPRAHNAGAGLAKNAKDGATVDLGGIGKNAGSSFGLAVGNQKGKAHSAGSGLATNAKNGATINLNGTGSNAGSTFTGGLGSKANDAANKGRNLASRAKSSAGSVSMHSTGANAGQGFINGLGSMVRGAADAAWNFGKSALHWLKKSIDSHSPSKETLKIGDFFTQGFENGINKNADSAAKSAAGLGDKALEATRNVVAGIKDAMDENLELEPKIKPVLDTTNIKNKDLDLNSTLQANARLANIGAPVQTTQIVKMDTKDLDTKLANLELKEHYGSNEPIYLMINDKVIGSILGPVIDQKQGSKISLTARGLAR